MTAVQDARAQVRVRQIVDAALSLMQDRGSNAVSMQAIEGLDDPVESAIEAFAEFCRAVDDNRHAVVLTYRESRLLSRAGLADVQRQELETLQPLVEAVRRQVHAVVLGGFTDAARARWVAGR